MYGGIIWWLRMVVNGVREKDDEARKEPLSHLVVVSFVIVAPGGG